MNALDAAATMLKSEAAAEQFARWVNGGGKRLPGLVRRREAEKQLFLAGTPNV